MAKLIIPLIFMAILGSMLSYVNGCGEVGSSGSEADLETVRIRLKGYFDSTLSSLDSKVKLVQFRVGKIRAGPTAWSHCTTLHRATSYSVPNGKYLTFMYQLDNIGIVELKYCSFPKYWP